MKYAGWVLVLAVAMGSVGCGRMDERAVYNVARDHVVQQVGEGVTVSSRRESLLAVNKNAARADINYTRGGSDPVEGYFTVWCKRTRLRWEFDYSTDSRNAR
ncbi:MAG: hypothetical protein HQ523_16705 [Lentisphaerae bacterium]|nr:hypothetical protein [Lentisphaerota bacterium]